MRLNRQTFVKNKATIISFLCWFTVFTIFQTINPYLTISNCSFPTISNAPEYDPDGKINKVLIIADPQLIDEHTYPGRSSALLKLSKFTVDNYIYKNYLRLIKQLKPNTIVFLGDLLDNGRESSDEHYEKEYQRFLKIFVNPVKNMDIQFMTNIPGNHDIGWQDGVTRHSMERFTEHFGHPNKVLDKVNHELIFLDDLSLAHSKDEDIPKPVNSFLDGIANEEKKKTRILLSHVPLWRDPNVQVCGAKRESKKPFPVATGYQYQTVLNEETSLRILQSVKPDIIFSGDDHDYCEVVHTYTDDGGEEHKTLGVNVKSISMAMGIKQPAVELLTLYNRPIKLNQNWYRNNQLIKNEGDTLDYIYDTCYLATPYVDIYIYIFVAVVDGVWLLFNSMERKRVFIDITTIDNNHKQGLFRRLVQSVNWLHFAKLLTINAILAMSLYYCFTIH